VDVASRARRRAEQRERRTSSARPYAGAPRLRRVERETAPRPDAARSKPALDERRGRRLAVCLGITALTAATLAIGLSILSAGGGGTASSAPSASGGVAGVAATRAMFGGIPQRGNVLGSPTAPVRLVEFADPQCPFCADYARDVLPTLLREYVRTGKVQLVFRGLAFLGADSVTALRTATAAASENRMWNVLEVLFHNQGSENAWVTEELLRSVVAGAGADADRVVKGREGAAVRAKIDSWSREAQAAGVEGVPAFFVGGRGEPLRPLAVTELTVAAFRPALDAALER
jgi:protein-disulfide isomerase